MAFTHPYNRVTVMTLDVTDEAQIRTAAAKVGSLDILINNAGVLFYDDLKDRTMVERHLATNFFGMHGMIQAFLPLLIRSQGAIVNNLSILALAPLPTTASYCISKAAASPMSGKHPRHRLPNVFLMV